MNRHGGLSGRWTIACLAISALCLGLGLGFRNALDAMTGQVNWTFSVGAPVFYSPVVANNKVYVVAGGRRRVVDAGTGDG